MDLDVGQELEQALGRRQRVAVVGDPGQQERGRGDPAHHLLGGQVTARRAAEHGRQQRL